MSKQNARHVSNNISSTQPSIKSTAINDTQSNSTSFVNYNASDACKKETIRKEQAAHRTWTTKYDPWFITEHRQMYNNMAKVHGISRESDVISLQRPEWQQPPNVFPPLNKRSIGQRRQRILGAFPQTENDMIGWRVLPQQKIEIYEHSTSMNDINRVRKELKFSNWPIESLY